MERLGRAAPVLLAFAGFATGAASLAAARHAPAASFAGRSVGDGMLELAAGWSICLVGITLTQRGRRAAATLLALSGAAWFAPEWANPGVGSSLVFTAGLVAFLASRWSGYVTGATFHVDGGRRASVL
jgi:hypothetical protein